MTELKEGDRVKLISLPKERGDKNSHFKIGMLGTFEEKFDDGRVRIKWDPPFRGHGDTGSEWNCYPIHIAPAFVNWREILQK